MSASLRAAMQKSTFGVIDKRHARTLHDTLCGTLVPWRFCLLTLINTTAQYCYPMHLFVRLF